jgi:hypothetical protein
VFGQTEDANFVDHPNPALYLLDHSLFTSWVRQYPLGDEIAEGNRAALQDRIYFPLTGASARLAVSPAMRLANESCRSEFGVANRRLRRLESFRA